MIIFVDFDGTIAQRDVGDSFFQTFGEARVCAQAVEDWRQNKISSKECLQCEAATVRVTPERLAIFCDAQPIAAGFTAFLRHCRQRSWPVYVLSDGLDYYIQRILQRHQITLPVYSNRLRFAPPDRVTVDFPFFEQSCGACGNCKGYQVRRLAQAGEPRIYIGDGLSDRCGAQEAEMIFAKDDLARWCVAHGKPYYPFHDFYDILDRLISQHES